MKDHKIKPTITPDTYKILVGVDKREKKSAAFVAALVLEHLKQKGELNKLCIEAINNRHSLLASLDPYFYKGKYAPVIS